MRRAMVAAALTALILPLSATAAAGSDSRVPFKDPNATGTLGFCDQHDKPVTAGNIDDVPFVWKVVASEPVPKEYAVSGAKATLFAYSPLPDINPGEWTPYQMTAASTFTSPKYPMVGTTYLDSPMSWHVTGAPPRWDGLVQLRMLYSAPNRVPQTAPYSAAVIKVTGSTWTLVSGDATPPCSAGKAVSVTRQVLPAKAIPKLPPTWAANYRTAVAEAKKVATKPTAAASTPSSPAPSAAPTMADPSPSVAPEQTGTSAEPTDVAAAPAAERRSAESRWPLIAVALLFALIIAAGIAAVSVWRRQ